MSHPAKLWIIIICVSLSFIPGGISTQANSSFLGAPYAPNLSPEFVISVDCTGICSHSAPQVAYNPNHQEYAVVWEIRPAGEQAYIFGQRIGRTGEQRGDPFVVGIAEHDSIQPAIAFDTQHNRYLVVWKYDKYGDGSVYDIWGRVIAADGSGVTPMFEIYWWNNRSFHNPRVTWNSTNDEFLVVWSAIDTTDENHPRYNDIAGVRLTDLGEKLPPHPAISISTAEFPHQADVIYNPFNNQYLVAWTYWHINAGPDTKGIRMAVIRWDGSLLHQEVPLAWCSGEGDFSRPSVATLGRGHYQVACHQKSSTPLSYGIRVAEVDSAGVQMMNATGFSQPGLVGPPDLANIPGSDISLQVYQYDYAGLLQIYADWMLGESSSQFAVTDRPASLASSPSVAPDHPGLIAYERFNPDDPTQPQRIYGRIWFQYPLYIPLVSH